MGFNMGIAELAFLKGKMYRSNFVDRCKPSKNHEKTYDSNMETCSAIRCDYVCATPYLNPTWNLMKSRKKSSNPKPKGVRLLKWQDFCGRIFAHEVIMVLFSGRVGIVGTMRLDVWKTIFHAFTVFKSCTCCRPVIFTKACYHRLDETEPSGENDLLPGTLTRPCKKGHGHWAWTAFWWFFVVHTCMLASSTGYLS